MALTEKQKRICEKYSARDKDGFVHCKECPLVVDHYSFTCRANSHYDRHRREWVADKMQNNLRGLAEQQDGILYIEQVEEWIEEIVEQLEEESDFFCGEPMGSLQKAYYCKGIQKAIEIVKGGVDNEN